MRAGGPAFQPKNNRVNREARFPVPGCVHSGTLAFRFSLFWPGGKVRGVVIIYLLSLEKYLCFALDLCFSRGGKWVESGVENGVECMGIRLQMANNVGAVSVEMADCPGVKLKTVKTGLLRSGYANAGRAKS